MIRSSMPLLDEAFCAAQGYIGASLINAVKGTHVFNPSNAAVCFAGIAFIEKAVYQISRLVIPGPTASFGPFSIGTQKIISYGLATYTTFKIMQLAGLILTVPQAITVIGITCSAALVIGSIATYVFFAKHYNIPLGEF